MLKVHEATSAAGALSAVFLRQASGGLEIVDDGGAFALPDGAVAAVMRRFGAALDPAADVAVVATLDLGAGRRLRHVRHLAGYDVIARDYLVYDEAAGGEPVFALATTVAGALAHLGRACAGGAR